MATITDDRRALADLKPNLSNYNKHDRPGVIEKMAARMRHHAFTAPLIVTPDGTILGGHLRRLALLKLKSECYPEPEGVGPGWVVPVRVFSGTRTQELAVLAGDNPDPADLDYDGEGLAAILSELQAAGEIEGSGYDEARLDSLIAELAGVTSEEPEAPEGFKDYGEDIDTEYGCPKCGYCWSGSPKPNGADEAAVSGPDDGGD